MLNLQTPKEIGIFKMYTDKHLVSAILGPTSLIVQMNPVLVIPKKINESAKPKLRTCHPNSYSTWYKDYYMNNQCEVKCPNKEREHKGRSRMGLLNSVYWSNVNGGAT